MTKSVSHILALAALCAAGLLLADEIQRPHEDVAAAGAAESALPIGSGYPQGAGVEITEAFRTLLSAARQGHEGASSELVRFWRTIGYAPAAVELDLHVWLGERPEPLGLSAQEAAQVQFRAGALYFDGRTAPRDYEQAAHW
jgi:TPR repeat protein